MAKTNASSPRLTAVDRRTLTLPSTLEKVTEGIDRFSGWMRIGPDRRIPREDGMKVY